MAENLAEDFVARPRETERLLDLLRKREEVEPIAGIVALVGAGGFGKTTLARAACFASDVQEAFDHGILWVTLGESPGDITRHLEDLIYTLAGERPGFSSLEAAIARLSELLADRDLLIVIDDVWDRAHMDPFLQGGPRCTRLITTRLVDALPPRAQKLIVGAMSSEEAVGLLGYGLSDKEEGTLQHLAGRLGDWPILLKLVNGVLRYRIQDTGQPFLDAAAYVDGDLTASGLTAFDSDSPAERNQAVKMTMGVSLKHLTENEQSRYQELSIFPEEEDIPLVIVEILWAKTGELWRLGTENLLSRLARLSLLQVLDLSARTIRLHDVIRHYLRDALGDAIPAVQRLFLDAQRPPSGWGDRSSEEPYLWDRLAYHLLDAGLGSELVTTVQDPWYLAAKTWLRGGLEVESDLRAALKWSGNRPDLRRLERSFAQSRHLLESCESRQELAVTLHSRLMHQSDLVHGLRRLEERLTPPYLIARQPVPDGAPGALRRTLKAGVPLNACAVGAGVLVGALRNGALLVWDMDSLIIRLRLTGHSDEVLCCAISEDGKLIASGSKDNTLRIWNAQSGEEICTMRGHSQKVNSCAFFPGEHILVSASDDRTLRFWDVEIGRELTCLTGHEGAARACAVHPKGSLILSISADRTIRWWLDLQAPPTKMDLPSVFGGSCCAFSSDGRYATCGFDNRVWVFDLQENLRYEFLSQGPLVTACAASAQGLVAASAFSGVAEIWNLAENRRVAVLAEHTDYVSGIAIDPRDDTIVTCSWDGTVRIWDVDPGHSVGEARRSWHEGAVYVCTSSADGKFLATTSDQEVVLWEPKEARILRRLAGHEKTVTDCAFSPDGCLLVSSSTDRTLKVWDVGTGEVRLTLAGHGGPVQTCCFGPNGQIILSGGGDFTNSTKGDNTLKLWDLRTGAEIITFEGHTWPVTKCAMSPDGEHIFSTSADGTLKVWNAQSGEVELDLEISEYPVNDCEPFSSEHFIVLALCVGTLEIRTLPDGELVKEIDVVNFDAGLNKCALSADNARIGAVGGDGTVTVWDSEDGAKLASIRTAAPVTNCTWCLSDRFLVAVGVRGVFFFELVLSK
ncbi:MAG TPA: NB-ARC domain-containing protein [Thermoanaerobaculia bacterium]|jgi:WD40 repeat protein